MNNKTKISFTLFLIMSLVFVFILGIVAFNTKNYGLQSAQKRAEAVANVVKFGLTAHMVNGTMDKREQFIHQVETLEQMNRIWLVRAPSVIAQYGKGLNNEVPQDKMDEEVVSSSKMNKTHADDFFANSTFRMTIPYIATQNGVINCLDCHDAKVGDTLGAISIEMDINDLRSYGISILGYVAVFALIMIIFILVFVNRLIGPYLHIFDSIKGVMQEANDGDYSHRIINIKEGEAKEVSKWVNTLLEKLQATMEEIENKIEIFLTNQKNINKDPLIQMKNTVSRLSDIYKFRKAIEHDERIEEVYVRFAQVLREKFDLKDFNFIEADLISKENSIVHAEKEILCEATKQCRADRTNTVVDSCLFSNACPQMLASDDTVSYLCLPYSISNELDFIISIVTLNEEESQRIRLLVPSINDYIDAAKPEIVSKKLTQILEKSSRTDAPTGLYNRKYLEESIELITSQAKRSEIAYGILMVDIDHFKMINDTYGHDVGDEAIRVISRTLEESIRNSDSVVRFGGEEFIVLLYNCNEEAVIEIAEKIRNAFGAKKIPSPQGSFSKTISIGASIYPTQSDSFWKCIKYADVALYAAKNGGRNRSVLFEETLLKDNELEDDF
ncbi:MAG: GGDEF domain-containing protein [Campylobacterota bacterium]|nr:GGDEF domain-containing protein [Campylobacterota bacterium]